MGKQQQGEEGCLCENEADICSSTEKMTVQHQLWIEALRTVHFKK